MVLVAGLTALVAQLTPREPPQLELCLAQDPGSEATLVVTATADRSGSARAYLLDQAGVVTQVGIGGLPTTLDRTRRPLVPARGPAGERVVLDGSDEALLVLWSETLLPSAGDALRAIRDPTRAALTVRPLSWEGRGDPRCARAALVPEGELALYRIPLRGTR